jgi:hypothetical protein
MIKREFTNSDIQILASRVNLAECTVREGERIDSTMQRDVIDSVRLIVEKEYLEVLKTIPIEEINADKSGIRIGVLKDNGINAVYDVLRTDPARLSAIYGFGPNMAMRAKAVTQRIANAIKKNVKIRLSTDTRTAEHTNLVTKAS